MRLAGAACWGIIMGSVRRWAILPVLTLIIAAMVAVAMPLARTETAPGPAKLNHACTLNANGLLRSAAIPEQCGHKGKGAAPHRDKPPVLLSSVVSRTVLVPRAASPTVVNHRYTAVGNTPLGVGTTPKAPAATVSGSVLTGDSDPDPTATLSVTATTRPAHGTVTMNPNGTFSYLPNPGYSGTDTFQCTIAGSNAPSQTATATVTITVGAVVWYVNNADAAAGNGEAATPFTTLPAANAAARANSIIFLYRGSSSYTGGVTMQPGEGLFGQPHGLTVDGYSLVSPGGSGSAPEVAANGNRDVIDLADGADVEGINLSNPSGNGIVALNIANATVGITNAVTVNTQRGAGIYLNGGDGNLNLGRTSVTTGSGGVPVDVANRSGGTVTFGGSITGTGVYLDNNAGATIAFTGRLTLSTGTNPAFTATWGGTITATGTGSTLTTTAGTALTVANTTIGGAGLTFQRVSSNASDADGIDLANTGSPGGLTVTGTGTPGSGGTIQNADGEGIQLTSTYAPSFTDMVIKNNAADGINGAKVNGLTLDGCTVSGNGTQTGVAGDNDDGLYFSPNGTGSPDGLTGTVSITNSTITGSADYNATISDTSGTLDLTVTGTTFSSDNRSTGNDGLNIDADATTNATVSVTGSTFTNNIGDAFQFSTDPASTGTDSVTFSNNTLNSTVAGIQGGGVDITPYGNSQTTITIDGNNIQNPVGDGIEIDEDGTTGTLSGAVSENTIGATAVANSGGGTGINVSAEGSVTETLAITGNKLYQYSGEAGIHFSNTEGRSTMELTMTGNTIAHPGEQGSWGIYGQDGSAGSDVGLVCAAITGNSVAGSAQVGAGGADIELDVNGEAGIWLLGYTGGDSNVGEVQSFLQGNNNVNGTPSAIALAGGDSSGFSGVPNC